MFANSMKVLCFAAVLMVSATAQASEQSKSANVGNACGDSARTLSSWSSPKRVDASQVPDRLLLAAVDTPSPGQQVCCCDDTCSLAPSKCVCSCKVATD